jgi:hypothetical protein
MSHYDEAAKSWQLAAGCAGSKKKVCILPITTQPSVYSLARDCMPRWERLPNYSLKDTTAWYEAGLNYVMTQDDPLWDRSLDQVVVRTYMHQPLAIKRGPTQEVKYPFAGQFLRIAPVLSP